MSRVKIAVMHYPMPKRMAADNRERDRRGPKYLKVSEIAEELSKSVRSVWRLIEDGELPTYRFGNSTRVKREDLDTYIERCRR